jgi:hypothetical protein
MNVRLKKDRRNSSPFGSEGPWLSFGKMGGLILTNRRTTADRRSEGWQRIAMASIASINGGLAFNEL